MPKTAVAGAVGECVHVAGVLNFFGCSTAASRPRPCWPPEGAVPGYTNRGRLAQDTVARIGWKAPLPILRHHFGLPTMADTRDGIARIAAAQVLDVVSLGIDQDAQANFSHPARQDPRRTGAGGVPVRTPDDYRALYQASRCGNYPLLRTYAGTDDFIRLAEMYVATIHIAWCAIPIF